MTNKLPKLLAKTMSMRQTNHTDDGGSGSSNGCTSSVGTRSKKKIWAISGAKNVCSRLRNALTSKKCSSSSSSSSEGNDHRVRDDESGWSDELERESLLEEKRKDDLNHNKNISDVQQNVSPPPTKVVVSSPFSGFLSKKLNKATSAANLTRVPSMGRFKSFRRTRKEYTITNDEPEPEPEKNETREEELCKKRILMGEKCRPLNASGALHYDDNGILLPEEILSCDDDEDY